MWSPGLPMSQDNAEKRTFDKRRDRPSKPSDRGGHRERGPGKGGRRDFKGGKGPRDGQRRDRRPRDDRGDRRRGDVKPEQKPQEYRLTIPSTPEKILFKGIDCEVNGRKDLALTLYLHGAARLSGGCETNAQRMLREMGRKEFPSARGRVAKSSPEDVLVAFDYICATLDEGYDRTFLDQRSLDGNPLATYSLIRLDAIDGDDPRIDTFASAQDERMVEEGLKRLVRKKDSERAASQLEALSERRKLRQTIRPAFVRAMKGDRQSLARLNELSSSFPEAGFLARYIGADDREDYIRNGLKDYRGTVMSVVSELGLGDSPFGRFLAAKRLQVEGEEWIPRMVDAAVAGSEDAVAELQPVQNRKDVRRGLASMYLARGDAVGLVRCYDGEDASFLERYCAHSPVRTVEVARLMGTARGIDWLKKGFLDGMEECRDELVSMAGSGEHDCKQLVYALHDVGAELEAAKLYFRMYGDRSLPSVKWLAKVCADEEAREYVRSRFEEMGDMATFESIFVDDGYEKKGARQGRGPRRAR